MKTRVMVAIVISLLLLAIGMIVFACSSRPQLSEVSPQEGATNVSAASVIRITFSRAMNTKSVIAILKITPEIKGTISWDKNSLIFTPNKPWPNGQGINLQLETGARAASWLSFPMGSLHWSFTTSKTSLAYLWPSTGPADIYTLDPVAGSIRQYTYAMDVLDYSASNDGRLLYFSAGNSQEGADLYRLDRIIAESAVDHSYQPEKLLNCGAVQCRNPVVSYDDQTLAYEYLPPNPKGGSGQARIWTLNLSSLVATPAGPIDHETVLPSWSSTGLLAYYDRTTSEYEILNMKTQERIRLLNQTGQPGTWSIDGAFYLAPEISYYSNGGSYETGASHLYRYLVGDNSSENISGDGAVEDVDAVYSPDGGSIAFTRKFLDAEHWSPGRQIWIMNSDGSNQRPVTEEPDYNHYDLGWSRDGLMLAYVRFNQVKISDPPELWMVSADGSNPVQLVIGGYSPVWIP